MAFPSTPKGFFERAPTLPSDSVPDSTPWLWQGIRVWLSIKTTYSPLTLNLNPLNHLSANVCEPVFLLAAPGFEWNCHFEQPSLNERLQDLVPAWSTRPISLSDSRRRQALSAPPFLLSYPHRSSYRTTSQCPPLSGPTRRRMLLSFSFVRFLSMTVVLMSWPSWICGGRE